jgi:hypothetical protein
MLNAAFAKGDLYDAYSAKCVAKGDAAALCGEMARQMLPAMTQQGAVPEGLLPQLEAALGSGELVVQLRPGGGGLAFHCKA